MLSEKGSLRETPAMKLLLTIFEQGLTGILYIKREDILKVLYFSRGKVIWAISNSDVDKLENILLDKGLVDPLTIKKIKTQARISDSIGKLLVEQGLITLEELIESTKEQLKRIIISVLKWKEGGFQFIKDAPPERLLSLDLEVVQFIVDFIVEEVELSEIWKEIGSFQVEFIKNPDEQKLAKYRLSNKQKELLNSFDGEKKLETILSGHASGHRESLLKIVYFFFMAELLIKKAFELSDLSFFEPHKGYDTFEPDGHVDKTSEPVDQAVPVKDEEPAALEPLAPERDEEPDALEFLVAERDEEPAALESTAPERDEESAALESIAPERDEEPAALEPTAPERDEEPAAFEPTAPERDEEPDALEPLAAERDEEPDALEPLAAERDEEPAALEPIVLERDEEPDAPEQSTGEDDYSDASYNVTEDSEAGIEAVLRKRLQGSNHLPVGDKREVMPFTIPGEKKPVKRFNIILIMVFLILVIGGVIFLLLPLLENTDNMKDVLKDADKRGAKDIITLEKKTAAVPAEDKVKTAETFPGTETGGPGEKKAGETKDKKNEEIETGKIPNLQDPKPGDRDRKNDSSGKESPALLPGKSAKAYFLEGSFITAGDVWKKELIKGRVKYGILLEMDCLKESVVHAYDRMESKEAFFLLNRKIGSKTCFLVMWGKFYSKEEATEAIKSIPAYFWQQSDPPGVIELSPYL